MRALTRRFDVGAESAHAERGRDRRRAHELVRRRGRLQAGRGFPPGGRPQLQRQRRPVADRQAGAARLLRHADDGAGPAVRPPRALSALQRRWSQPPGTTTRPSARRSPACAPIRPTRSERAAEAARGSAAPGARRPACRSPRSARSPRRRRARSARGPRPGARRPAAPRRGPAPSRWSPPRPRPRRGGPGRSRARPRSPSSPARGARPPASGPRPAAARASGRRPARPPALVRARGVDGRPRPLARQLAVGVDAPGRAGRARPAGRRGCAPSGPVTATTSPGRAPARVLRLDGADLADRR